MKYRKAKFDCERLKEVREENIDPLANDLDLRYEFEKKCRKVMEVYELEFKI